MEANTDQAIPSKRDMKSATLDPKQLAIVMNLDKQIMKSVGAICFRRCIPPEWHIEYLNDLEMNCVDRCVNKYDRMIKFVTNECTLMKVDEGINK